MSGYEPFHTIAAETTEEIVVKGSRFVARAAPAGEKEQAEQYIAAISSRFHDATHNCFAFKIGVGDQAVFRFGDAGEPSGTAGRPILQAIENKNLTNLSVVVTRYFGGTKLGTGGLIRAYSAAALTALNRAKITVHFPQTVITLKFAYSMTNPVHQVVEKFGAKILATRFEDQTFYRVRVKASEEEKFKEELLNLTSGKISLIP
ncbi:MAG: IMPACT family protein [bacterium]